MWNLIQPWQIKQLQRLASMDPERVETMLNTLCRQYDGLFGELAILATDQEEISVERCAQILGLTQDEVESRLHAFRMAIRTERAVVHDGTVARLYEGRVPVWEVVREYRKLGSVERLSESFPSLTQGELAAALKYAEANPQEIEGQIARYEEVLVKRRAEYPFAR
jgi:uncharacterized protein (DUF433 family)